MWDAGSDHGAELAEIDAELVDVTGLIGTPEFRAGTPQRARLDQRIAELATRQEQLSAESVRPAGWSWQSTGENFGEWWSRQDTTSRNMWLRSMNVRLEFAREKRHIIWGDVTTMAEQVNGGPIVLMKELFAQMAQGDIAGVEINAGGDTIWHHNDRRTVSSTELDART